jgi:hypothetical protein
MTVTETTCSVELDLPTEITTQSTGQRGRSRWPSARAHFRCRTVTARSRPGRSVTFAQVLEVSAAARDGLLCFRPVMA